MAWALVSGATFRTSPVPRRADVLETGDFGGDKLSGLPRHVGEPWRADVSWERCKHLEPVFGGKRANLEAQAAQKTQDTKNALFWSLPFSALFAPKTER